MGYSRIKKSTKEERKRSSFLHRRLFRMHPLFLTVGIWYAFTGELFLFFLSTLVAVQHECAHAFAAAKLGYRLNAIVLMPFGAVIDGDLKGISLKDEIFVAICGPLCNLVTAIFFVALWWLTPTMYAFTDVVCYSSLSIALVNLLPCYPLDGGRILQCSLTRFFGKKQIEQAKAERSAKRICKGITLLFSLLFLFVFLLQCLRRQPNFTLLAFGVFLLVGGVGNKDKSATYEKLDFAFTPSLKTGVEIRRVAISGDCPVKDSFRFLARGYYLVLEVYDDTGRHIFNLPQNQLSALFLQAETPYETLINLYNRQKSPSVFP